MSIYSRLKTGGVALIVMGVMAGLGAFAQEEPTAAHLAAARAAINALSATDQFDEILLATAEGLKANLIQSTPDIQPQIDAAVNEVALSLAPRRGDLEREAASIYAKNFKESELKAITEFYTSDAGKKLLENGPLVTRELLKAAEIWANGIERDMAELTAEKLHTELGNRPKIEEVEPAKSE